MGKVRIIFFFSIVLCFYISQNSSLFRSLAVLCLSLLQTPSPVCFFVIFLGWWGGQKSESGCHHCCSHPRAVKNANQGFTHT